MNDGFENAKTLNIQRWKCQELERLDYVLGLIFLLSLAPQSVIHGPAPLASSANWLEMQNL